MGKSKTKNIDNMSAAELDKLLDKHGSGKFSPTPQEHYMYYFGAAFVTVLLGSYIFASGRFASVATDNIVVTLAVFLIGAGGLAVSYDKYIQDLKPKLAADYMGKNSADPEQRKRNEDRLLQEAVPRAIFFCNVVFAGVYWLLGIWLLPGTKETLQINDQWNFIITTLSATVGQALWHYEYIE